MDANLEIGRHLRKATVALAFLLPAPLAFSAETIEYIHTDALGSPVAVTDASGNVIERTVYEPYGAVVGGQVKDGPGYTGHVSDAATGLSYMQQRYMDPQIGVFLSVDPVVAYQQPLLQFHRYRYGNGNPYRFTDPDGRQPISNSLRFVPPIPVSGASGNSQRNESADDGARSAGPNGERPTSRPTARPTGRDTVRRGRDGQPIEQKTPGERVSEEIDKVREGKTPVSGKAGERGELEGKAGEADGDWQRIKSIPGAEDRGGGNIRLPDGSNANRHGSTRPYKDGPGKGTDTIKHYPVGSAAPGTTIRYPKE